MNFPRSAVYASNRSWGHPFLLPDGKPNMPVIQQAAKHKTLTMDVPPWLSIEGDSKPEVLLQLRKANPTIRLVWYRIVVQHWLAPSVVPAATALSFNDTLQRRLRALNGWLLNDDGTPILYPGSALPWPLYIIDIARRDVTDMLLEMYLSIDRSSLFDRIAFLDVLGMGWLHAKEDAAGRMANIERMVNALEREGIRVIQNGIYAQTFNPSGSMVEMADYGSPSQFETARMKWEESRETESWLQWFVPDRTSATSARTARFAIGTGCLFGANTSVGPNRSQSVIYQGWEPWPEQMLNLGEPLGPATQTGGLWRRAFVHGTVYVNPTGAPLPRPDFVAVPPMDAAFVMVQR